MAQTQTRVLIIGGGPAGLVLALELGRRGVACTVFEQNSGPPTFPKANSTTSRTMEHYRRLGVAGDIRGLGLPDDYPPDISYHTRLAGYELARLHWPSRRQALEVRHESDPTWPTPEPIHRAQQMLIEPVLKSHAERNPSIDLRFGWQAVSIAQTADAVCVTAVERATGRSTVFAADYAVGCDGPRSIVRDALGIKYAGIGAEDREFLGGRMLATHLDAPAVYELPGLERSWQYWLINRQRFGILVAIDGKGRFVFHSQLPRGSQGSEAYARELIALAGGCEFPYQILGLAEWTAGFTLVAERFGGGRLFLAGDAAHLFTPTAGLGYNTSVDDAANFGWKLAAVCQGWGGPGLLDSYEAERKPAAERNTRFARSIAEFYRGVEQPEGMESDGPQGAAARARFGKHLHDLATREFSAPGIHFGAFYGGSPIVAPEPGELPADDPNRYMPNARPGSRAPHLWLQRNVAVYDRFGPDFTLLKLARDRDTAPLEKAAAARGMPLAVLAVENSAARDLYQRDLVLVRPDQHIAWRGDQVPVDPVAIVDISCGARVSNS